jgi:hypothetical protein
MRRFLWLAVVLLSVLFWAIILLDILYWYFS